MMPERVVLGTLGRELRGSRAHSYIRTTGPARFRSLDRAHSVIHGMVVVHGDHGLKGTRALTQLVRTLNGSTPVQSRWLQRGLEADGMMFVIGQFRSFRLGRRGTRRFIRADFYPWRTNARRDLLVRHAFRLAARRQLGVSLAWRSPADPERESAPLHAIDLTQMKERPAARETAKGS